MKSFTRVGLRASSNLYAGWLALHPSKPTVTPVLEIIFANIKLYCVPKKMIPLAKQNTFDSHQVRSLLINRGLPYKLEQMTICAVACAV